MQRDYNPGDLIQRERARAARPGRRWVLMSVAAVILVVAALYGLSDRSGDTTAAVDPGAPAATTGSAGGGSR